MVAVRTLIHCLLLLLDSHKSLHYTVVLTRRNILQSWLKKLLTIAVPVVPLGPRQVAEADDIADLCEQSFEEATKWVVPTNVLYQKRVRCPLSTLGTNVQAISTFAERLDVPL